MFTYYESFVALKKSSPPSARPNNWQNASSRTHATVRLKTMPKVGRIASLTFLSAVDDVERFPTSREAGGLLRPGADRAAKQ